MNYYNNDLTANDTRFQFSYSGNKYGYKNASGTFVPFENSSDATATADKILSGFTAYAKGQKLTGTASASASSKIELIRIDVKRNWASILEQYLSSIDIYLFILTSSGTVDFHSYNYSGVMDGESVTIYLTHSSITSRAVFTAHTNTILKLSPHYGTNSFYIKLSAGTPTNLDIEKSDYNFNTADVGSNGNSKCKLLILN